jgi:Holliday junction resolvase
MKAKTPTEKEIRTQIKQYLERKGWFVFYHLQGLGSYPGLPDLQAVKDGHTLYIEIKRPGGRQSAKQRKFQQDLEAAGGIYILAKELAYIKPVCGLETQN